MSDARLKSYVDRIERLREERKSLLDDERDIFVEVKAAGFDGPALRKVLQRRATEPAKLEELDALIDLYESSLDSGKRVALEAIRGGASIRDAAKAGGITKSVSGVLAKGVDRPQKRDLADSTESDAGVSTREDETSAGPLASGERDVDVPPASDTRNGLPPVGNGAGLSPVPDLEMPSFLRRV